MFGCKSSILAWNVYHFSKGILSIILLWIFVLSFQATFADLTTFSQCQQCYTRAKADQSIYSFTGCSCFLQEYTNRNSLDFPKTCINLDFIQECDLNLSCKPAKALSNLQMGGFWIHEQGHLNHFKISLLGSIFLFFLACASGIAFYACADHIQDQIFFSTASFSLFCSQFLFIVLCCIYSNLENDGCFFVDLPLNFIVIISSISLFNLILIVFTFIFVLLPDFLEYRSQIIRCICAVCLIQSVESISVFVYSSDLTLQLFSLFIFVDWVLISIYIAIQHVSPPSVSSLKPTDYSEATGSDEDMQKSIIDKLGYSVSRVVGSYDPISAAEEEGEESSSLSEGQIKQVDVVEDVRSESGSEPRILRSSVGGKTIASSSSGVDVGTIIGERPDTAKTDKTFAIGMAQPLPPPKSREQTGEALGVLDEEEFSEQASSSYPSMKPRITELLSDDISRSFPGISSTHITDHPTSGITSSSDSSFDSDDFQEQYWSKSSFSMTKPPPRQHQSFSQHRLIELSKRGKTDTRKERRKWSDTVVMAKRHPRREDQQRYIVDELELSSSMYSDSSDEYEQRSLPSRFDQLVAARRKASADSARRFATQRKRSQDPSKWNLPRKRKSTDPLDYRTSFSRVRKGTDPEVFRRRRRQVMRREERKAKKRKQPTKKKHMMKLKPSERRKHRKIIVSHEPSDIRLAKLPSEMIHRHSGAESFETSNVRDDRSVWSDTTEMHIPKADFGRKKIAGRAKVLRLHE